jgi:hypothetical protein
MARYPARHGYRRGAASLARLLVSHAAQSLRRRLGSAVSPTQAEISAIKRDASVHASECRQV